jgi:hypothetical protein
MESIFLHIAEKLLAPNDDEEISDGIIADENEHH